MLDERALILTSRVFERYQWTDPRLSWNPSKYGGIELIHVPSSLVWLPDNMRALNSVNEEFTERDDITVAVNHKGLVYWFPKAVYKTFCTRSTAHYHTYHCHIGFGPWSQGIDSLPMKLLFHPGVEIDDSIFYDQCPFYIEDIRVDFKRQKYDCCPEPFHLLGFEFNVHRREAVKERKAGDKKELSEDCIGPHCP